jgi:hypothetical protein
LLSTSQRVTFGYQFNRVQSHLMTRLRTISINISTRFEQSSEVEQRKVVGIACRRAVSDANLTGQEIELALQLIESGGRDAGLHDKLKAIADEFDEVYFDMTDDADEAQAPFESEELTNAAMVNFRKSRAAQALAYGVSEIGTLYQKRFTRLCMS